MGKLFGADGIHGTLEHYPLRQTDLEILGQALGDWLHSLVGSPTILIGTDTRESSHRIKTALVGGLSRRSVTVVDGGILPTPAVSFLVARKGSFAAGVVISASHNPITENGIKIFDHSGKKLGDATETVIEEIFGKIAYPWIPRAGNRSYSEPNYASEYATHLISEREHVDWKTVHLLLDCANGAAYQIAQMVTSRLSIPHVLVNASPDGTNINLQAGSEAVRSNPQRFAAYLRRFGKHIGVAVDGDADRVIMIDAEGRVYDGDYLLAMLAIQLHAVRQLPGSTVVTTRASNTGLATYLHRNGIHTRIVQNGDKYITEELIDHTWTLGGEQIGHVIIRSDDSHITGDGLRTALSILTYLAENPGMTLLDLAPGMRKNPQIKASIYLGKRTTLRADDVPGLESILNRTRLRIPDLLVLDCRPASTEPVYRLQMEALHTDTATLAKFALPIAEHIQLHAGHSGLGIEILDCVSGGQLTTGDTVQPR